MSAHRSLLSDGRWHFQHGPMDLIIHAEGKPSAVAAVHENAWVRFTEILAELVAELPVLRSPVGDACALRGPVARRMWRACKPYRDSYITPMAAVAGAVAQEVVACYCSDDIARAWVNNGGDIALHLTPLASVRVGLYADIARLTGQEILDGMRTDGQFEVTGSSPVRGIATSGWRGRSFSLGIADSVTVLARTAAEADAAATVIANAVNVGDSRILRLPACELKDDTDLGAIPVTVDVPQLEKPLILQALQAGLKCAQELHAAGLICSAALVCQDQVLATEGINAVMPEITKKQLAENKVGSVFA